MARRCHKPGCPARRGGRHGARRCDCGVVIKPRSVISVRLASYERLRAYAVASGVSIGTALDRALRLDEVGA